MQGDVGADNLTTNHAINHFRSFNCEKKTSNTFQFTSHH